MALMSSSDLGKKIKAENFDRLYYFYGHDVGALEAYAKKLIAKLCPAEDQMMNLHQFNGKKIEVGDVVNACEALPMFAQRVVVTINDLNMDTVSAADAKVLREALSNLPETTVVVIYSTGVELFKNKRNLSDANNKFAKFCADNGVACDFAYKSVSSVGKNIVNSVRAAGCDISKSDAEYLANCCLCNTVFVNQEIAKLTAYAANRTITRADIDALCIKQVESDGFALALNILRSNASMVFGRVGELFDQNNKETEILYVIGMSMTDLYRAKLARSSGRGYADCAHDFKYPKNREFAVKNAYSECSNITCERIRRCLKIFAQADFALKTGIGGNDRRLVLEQAIASAMALQC